MSAQETGRVAISAIDGLKANPACLAAILMAAMFAILLYFSQQQAEQRAHERTVEVMKLLHACFPAGGEPTYPPRGKLNEQ